MAVTTFTRRYVFQSVHRLPAVHEAKHGHHFYLELTYRDVDPELADRSYREFVEPELHGREIRVVTPPTGEKIVEWIHERLLSSPLGPHLLAVALQETEKNRYLSSRSEVRFV